MKKKGFTLIELLIVIAIIGILAVAFLPSLLGAPAKGRDAQRMAAVQKIENFLVSKMLTGTALPATGCVDSGGAADTIGKLIKDNVADFGGVYPKDPQTTNVATGAVNGCTGMYGYVKYPAGGLYTASVYAAVEKVENANVKCGSIVAAAAPTTLVKVLPVGATVPAGSTTEVALVAGEVACYLALIQ